MRKLAVSALALIMVLSCALIGTGRFEAEVLAQSGIPELRRVGPARITTGDQDFTLRLEGRRFEPGAQVLLNGQPLASPRVPRHRLMFAEVPASVVAATGSHTVQVVNPEGGLSEVLTLEVVEKEPDLDIRLGGTAAQEGIGQDLTFEILGSGFDNRSRGVFWGTEAPNTEFISDDRLTVQFPAEFGDHPARIPVLVRNRGGALSNYEIFHIVPRPGRIDLIEPDSIEVGDEDFELIVRGGNYKTDARILVNGAPIETEFVRGTRLDGIVPASFRETPTQLIIRVEQEGIQSVDFTLAVTPTEGPFIYSVAPARVVAGQQRADIDFVGANFRSGLAALVDGEEVQIRSRTQRRLTVRVPRALIAEPGIRSIQVTDRDEIQSNIVQFEIVPDVEVATLTGQRVDGFNTDPCVGPDQARLRRPSRITLAPDGLLYITDLHNHAIRSVNPDTGEVCTIAGTGLDGYNDTGNPAGFAPTFSFPLGVAVDSDGSIYVTENGNNVIRRIIRNQGAMQVETFAGGNEPISNPDRQQRLNSTRRGLGGFRDGPVPVALFRQPDDILVAPDGAIYVSDPLNHSIRRIRITDGEIEVITLAGNGVPGFADGDASNARFFTPTGIALSPDGEFLYVADSFSDRIRRINLATLRVETVAGSGQNGTRDGPPGEAQFNVPIALAVDEAGVIYVVEHRGNRIRRIDQAGNVTTLAGTGNARFRDGEGLIARFNNPRGIVFDPQRRALFIADFQNFRVRRIDLD